MLSELDDWDWREAFGYAGESDTCATRYQHDDGKPMRCEGSLCETSPFGREQVVEILHSREGENDGPDWLMIGRLDDGRFFYLEAGCDYTGWDCQAGGSAWVSHDLDNLLQFGITDQARTAFKL